MFLKKIQAKYQVLAVEKKKFKVATDIATIAVVDAKFAKSKGAMFFEEEDRLERITTPQGKLLVTLKVGGKIAKGIIQSNGEIIVGDPTAMFSRYSWVGTPSPKGSIDPKKHIFDPALKLHWEGDQDASSAFFKRIESHKKTEKYFDIVTGADGSFNVEISIKKYKDKIKAASREIGVPLKNLEIKLGAAKNPDFEDVRDPIIKPFKQKVSSLEEAQKVARKFIDDNLIGGGSWYAADAGWVFENGKKIARIAYNGTIIKG